MAMDAQDWADLASVYRAGADRARGWPFNNDRQQDSGILEAQADRCDEIARRRDGNPPVTHEHEHEHWSGEGRDRRKIIHRHEHTHASGETGHDPDSQVTSASGLIPAHPHDRDPFAPPEWGWQDRRL